MYDPFIRGAAVAELRRHYASRPGDVFVATYPKAGTTWLQTVVLLLLHQGDASKVGSGGGKKKRRKDRIRLSRRVLSSLLPSFSLFFLTLSH